MSDCALHHPHLLDLPHGPYEPGQVLKFLKDHKDYCEKAEKRKVSNVAVNSLT